VADFQIRRADRKRSFDIATAVPHGFQLAPASNAIMPAKGAVGARIGACNRSHGRCHHSALESADAQHDETARVYDRAPSRACKNGDDVLRNCADRRRSWPPLC
jgi:hypothetical protein